MNKKKSASYDVGYGKPPQGTRFQRGQSGNPSGRPKGSKSPLQQLRAAAREMITVTINGRPRRITKFDAMCQQLINNALKGDTRAQRLAFSLLGDEGGVEKWAPINITISPTDAKL